jgi:hypothetical protein
MNWTKGLFRLWIVVSALWIIFMLGFAAGENPNFWQFALIPPLAVLAVGAALVWAVKGFRKSA